MSTTLTVLMVVLFGYAIWTAFSKGQITVKPKGVERVVIRNLRGTLAVLGPGDHFLPPWWTIFERVVINREPVQVVGEEVKASNGVILLIDYRYDFIAGRPFDEVNHGQLTIPPSDIDKEVNVLDKHIISAVTIIEYKDRHKQVAERISAVIERQLAALQDIELMLPGVAKPRVPQTFNNTPVKDQWIFLVENPDTKAELKLINGQRRRVYFGSDEPPVFSAAELYERLGLLIELKVNKEELLHVGLNVIGFRINNLRYKDDPMQRSVEMAARLRNLRQQGSTLSDAELLASTEPGLLGQAAGARGLVEAAKALGDGMRNFGKGSPPSANNP